MDFQTTLKSWKLPPDEQSLKLFVKFSSSENNHVYSIFMGTNFCGHDYSVFSVSKLEYIFLSCTLIFAVLWIMKFIVKTL